MTVDVALDATDVKDASAKDVAYLQPGLLFIPQNEGISQKNESPMLQK